MFDKKLADDAAFCREMAMRYVESNLIAGETIQYRTGLHWIVLFWPLALASVFGLSGLGWLIGAVALTGSKDASSAQMAIFALPLLFVAACFIGYGILRRMAVEMAVTNKRVVIKYGVISRKTFELLLSRIESIGVDEGIMGRMMGYGTVVVRGTGGTPEPFKRIGHPLEFRRQVQQQIEASEQMQGER